MVDRKDQYCSLDSKNKSYCTPQTYKGQSSTLFHNKGNGTFENVTKRAGLYDPTSKSLGVALLDYDNDGWLDLFVSNDTEPNKLYHNNHNGTFTDVAVRPASRSAKRARCARAWARTPPTTTTPAGKAWSSEISPTRAWRCITTMDRDCLPTKRPRPVSPDVDQVAHLRLVFL